MKYKFHIVLALLSVLVGVIVACFFVGFSEKIMTHSALRHLDSVATLQEIRLSDVLMRYRSEVQLVQSRTNMRKQLNVYFDTDDRSSLEVVENILNDAVSAVPNLLNLYIIDLDNNLVVSTDSLDDLLTESVSKLELNTDIQLLGFFDDVNHFNNVVFTAPLHWEEIHIANVIVEFSAETLLRLSETYVGLGNSGETGIAMKLNNDEFQSLTRLRHKMNDLLSVGKIHDKGGNSPIRKALLGFEELFVENITDYRSVDVIAATRHVDDFDTRFALTVKMDKDEIFQDFERLKFMVIFSIFGGLSALAMIIGIYMMVSQMLYTHKSPKKKK